MTRPVSGQLRALANAVPPHLSLVNYEIASLLIEGIPPRCAAATLGRLDHYLAGLARAVGELRDELERLEPAAAVRDAEDMKVTEIRRPEAA